MDIEKAYQTQLANIQTKTNKSLDQLFDIIRQSGLSKHGEIRDMLKNSLGLGHGDANTLTLFFLNPPASSPVEDDAVLDEIYAGPKAALRPIHEAIMAELSGWGEFEIVPKKGYVSLRRKKQFAMLGPATNSRVELGLNMKGVPGTERLAEQPAGGMCQYKVKLTSANEVDTELFGWLRTAFDSAG